MDPQILSSAILADRHLGFAEGVRGLLEAVCRSVYVVADVDTLTDGTERLQPALVVLDLSLAGRNLGGLLATIRERSPDTRVIILSLHDQPSVADLALAAGANAVVLKRCAGADFLAALDAVARGEAYVSPGLDPANAYPDQ